MIKRDAQYAREESVGAAGQDAGARHPGQAVAIKERALYGGRRHAASLAVFLRQLIVNQPPDAALIYVAQLDRQGFLWKVLIADRAGEAVDRRPAHWRRAGIGHGEVGRAVTP